MEYIAILGSTGFHDYELFKHLLAGEVEQYRDDLNDGDISIITSNAVGTATLVDKYAKEKMWDCSIVEPDYEKHKGDAAERRNKEIIDLSFVIFVFDGGEEFIRGILEYARSTGKDVISFDVTNKLWYRDGV